MLDSKAFDDELSVFNQLLSLTSFAVHAAFHLSIAKHARIRRCRSLLFPEKLRVDGLSKKAAITTYRIFYSNDLFACRSAALHLGQYHSNSHWNINESENLTIDIFCGPQSVWFGAY